MEFEDEKVTELAEKLQDDCHRDVDAICGHNPKVDYRDATSVWVFRKMAQLELRIEQLEKLKIETI